jgi:hypothetical protein
VRTPLDRIFKNTAEIEPRGMLHLFGSLRLHEPAEVKELGFVTSCRFTQLSYYRYRNTRRP